MKILEWDRRCTALALQVLLRWGVTEMNGHLSGWNDRLSGWIILEAVMITITILQHDRGLYACIVYCMA